MSIAFISITNQSKVRFRNTPQYPIQTLSLGAYPPLCNVQHSIHVQVLISFYAVVYMNEKQKSTLNFSHSGQLQGRCKTDSWNHLILFINRADNEQNSF